MRNTDRDKGYSATNWWMRSPNTGNAYNVYNVNTTGALNNNNAYNGNGVAPDRKCRQHKVSRAGNRSTEIRAKLQGAFIHSRRETREHMPPMPSAHGPKRLSTAALFYRGGER